MLTITVYVCQDSEQMHPHAESGSMLDEHNNVLIHSEGLLVSLSHQCVCNVCHAKLGC